MLAILPISSLVHLEYDRNCTFKVKFGRNSNSQSQVSFITNGLWSDGCLLQKMAAMSDSDGQTHLDYLNLVTWEFVAYFLWNKETWPISQPETSTHLSPRAREYYYLRRQHCHLGDGKAIFQSQFGYGRGGGWKHGKIEACSSSQWFSYSIHESTIPSWIIAFNWVTLFFTLIQRFYPSRIISGVLPF